MGLTRWPFKKGQCGRGNGWFVVNPSPMLSRHTNRHALLVSLTWMFCSGRKTNTLYNQFLLLIFDWVNRNFCYGMRQKNNGLKCQRAFGRRIQSQIHASQGGLLYHLGGNKKMSSRLVCAGAWGALIYHVLENLPPCWLMYYVNKACTMWIKHGRGEEVLSFFFPFRNSSLSSSIPDLLLWGRVTWTLRTVGLPLELWTMAHWAESLDLWSSVSPYLIEWLLNVKGRGRVMRGLGSAWHIISDT